MAILPAPVQNLINALSRLPGIGPKTASRLAFFLLRENDDLAEQLAKSLTEIKTGTGTCKICHNITLASQELCEIFANPQRADGTLCVVEDAMDVLAMERTGGFSGRYHVLQGVLSPIEGVGPDDLKIRSLLERVRTGEAKEIIIATNPSMEGDATALYLRQQLLSMNVRITRLARGLPVGGDLEYADQNTLLRALSGRQEMS
jgi:recombination protein RecR